MTDVQTTTEAQPRSGELSPGEPGRPATASTRRVVLLGAGAAGATCLLAACGTGTSGDGNSNGSDFSDTPAPAGSTAASTDGGGSTGGVALAAVAEVPEGGGVIKGDWVITQPTAGTFKAFSKVCTHQGCPVTKVDGGAIKCPCHNSSFTLDTGEPTGGPANAPLAEKKVKREGDNIVAA